MTKSHVACLYYAVSRYDGGMADLLNEVLHQFDFLAMNTGLILYIYADLVYKLIKDSWC